MPVFDYEPFNLKCIPSLFIRSMTSFERRLLSCLMKINQKGNVFSLMCIIQYTQTPVQFPLTKAFANSS